jgi:hypothetical protein
VSLVLLLIGSFFFLLLFLPVLSDRVDIVLSRQDIPAVAVVVLGVLFLLFTGLVFLMSPDGR